MNFDSDSQLDVIYINNYKLYLTCSACPEQYDVFIDEKSINNFNISDEEKLLLKLKYFNNNEYNIGYLRLRHGNFTAEFINEKNEYEIVYKTNPEGDGMFDKDERMYYLKEAIRRINLKLIGITDSVQEIAKRGIDDPKLLTELEIKYLCDYVIKNND